MRRGSAALAALAALIAGVTLAHARSHVGLARPVVLHVAGQVSDLSADGARVAFHLRTGRCQTVWMWKPGLGLASMRPDCGHNVLVQNLTLAGSRALWVDYDTGNHVYCLLMTATLARPKPTELPECDPTDQDRELHGLAGDGSLLAFNSWYDCDAPGATCIPGHTVYDVEVWRVFSGRLKKIASGQWPVMSVDAGRILIPNGTLALFDANGKELWMTPSSHNFTWVQGKLQGSRLVALGHGTAPCCIRSYFLAAHDSKTGRQTGDSKRVSAKASLRDFQDGIALYLLAGVGHAVRMSDGRDRAFRAPGGRPILDAELERPGLFYSYNVLGGAKRGRIAFVRFADLRR